MALSKALIRSRKKITQENKAKPEKKIPLRKEPTKEELKYKQELFKMINSIQKQVKKNILPAVNVAVKESEKQLKVDNISSDLDKKLNELTASVTSEFNKSKILSIIAPIAGGTVAFNKFALNQQLKAVTGVDLIRDPAFIRELQRLFIRENVKRITALRNDTLARVNDTIFSGVRSGLTSKSISNNLISQFGISKNKAILIAKDQISKLDGQLTQVRQEAVGIERYTWITVGDERVRPKHRSLNGQEFTWDNPPSEGHPGEPVNCRCQAEPNIDNLIENL